MVAVWPLQVGGVVAEVGSPGTNSSAPMSGGCRRWSQRVPVEVSALPIRSAGDAGVNRRRACGLVEVACAGVDEERGGGLLVRLCDLCTRPRLEVKF